MKISEHVSQSILHKFKVKDLQQLYFFKWQITEKLWN